MFCNKQIYLLVSYYKAWNSWLLIKHDLLPSNLSRIYKDTWAQPADTQTNFVPHPLAVQHLDNQLYILTFLDIFCLLTIWHCLKNRNKFWVTLIANYSIYTVTIGLLTMYNNFLFILLIWFFYFAQNNYS